VRDNESLSVLRCNNCSLVFLSSFDHVSDAAYGESEMMGQRSVDVEHRLRDNARDDARRFDFLRSSITNRDVLDFGSGVGGFALHASSVCMKSRYFLLWMMRLAILAKHHMT